MLNYLLIFGGCSLITYTTDRFLLFLFGNKARWFQLHFFVNMYITAITLPDVIACFIDPNMAFEPIGTIWGECFAFTLHLYHTFFFNLSTIDKYHHMCSVFTCTPLCVIYGRKPISLYCFFGTGLPGGIDYMLLWLVKNNRIEKVTEKNVNAILNTYIRMPGGIIASYLVFTTISKLQNEITIFAAIVLSCLVYMNVTIFGKMAIENNIEHQLKPNRTF